MGIHEWSYDNDITSELRHKVPWRDVNQALRNIKVEVELGFDVATAWKEAQRCDVPGGAKSRTRDCPHPFD